MANTNNPQSVIPDVEYNVEGDFVTVPVPEGADTGKVLGAISEGHVGWVEDQGAGVIQQQSDWTETDDTKVSFILHKPTGLVQDADYVHTDNNFTDAEKTKLAGIAAGAEVNVQSNWNESDSSSDAFIANKPTQKPVVAGANISIVDGQDAVTISATVPTVDQTYDATSANAQSGTAVAGAIAGVNQVPASTSSDANKVLTVDSQGVPGWATPAAPSGGGSDEWWGGDPGYISVSSKILRLRFKDTTYDPRNDPDTTFIAKFTSITKVSDGVYDFACNDNQSNMFQNKYTTDNEFIVLALNVSFNSCSRMFMGCTGLRAVYNLVCNGSTTTCSYMFNGCTNLMEVRCGTDATNNAFKPRGSCDNMFGECTRLKSVDMYLPDISTSFRSINRMCYACSSLELGPSFGPAVSNCQYAFNGCGKLLRFADVSEYTVTTYVHSNSVRCEGMFNGCRSIQSMNGLGPFFLGTTISNASAMFNGCICLQEVPYIKLENGTNCSSMFSKCASLKKVPEMDWGNITNMTTMFKDCSTLVSLNDKETGTQWYSGTLNASLSTVSSMFTNCFGIREGLGSCYTGLSSHTGITTYEECFHQCGVAYNNPDLAQIPSAWGGGAA